MTKHTKKTGFKIGDILIIGHYALPDNSYAGFLAKVEYCKTCCKEYRLQMLEFGNNVNMSDFDHSKLYKIL
jgi:hypothetical protein